MAAVKPSTKSNYFRSLEGAPSKRYQEKISLLGGRDPYVIKTEECSDQVEDFPNTTYPDIVNYLVFTKSAYTLQEFKSYKSLEAYNQFSFGWVRDVKCMKFNKHRLVIGKVLHSMRVHEPPLHAWVIAAEDGDIISAHCTCMAGLGESCTHVAALLFYVEYCMRNHVSKSVTDVASYWLPPSLKDSSFSRMKDVNFCTPKRQQEKLESATTSTRDVPITKPVKDPCPEQTPQDFYDLLQQLHLTGCSSAVLSVVRPFSEDFIPSKTTKNNVLHLPSFYEEENGDKTREELVEIGKKLNLKITEAQCVEVEKKSINQANSKVWFEFRAGRVTASRFMAACRTKTAVSAPSLVKAICYPQLTKIKSSATEWGCRHEKTARQDYVKSFSDKHTNFKVEDVGLLLNPEYPCFGASPDALVSCDCCGAGCLEIKCPYCIKDTTVEERGNKLTCLKKDDHGSLYLSKTHAYYFQIQAQLFISKRKYCDFFLWCPNGDPHYERIFPDVMFWEREEPKAKKFFQEAIIPELLGKFFSKPSVHFKEVQNEEPPLPQDDEVWCICGADKGGKWIMCDREGCNVLWFHIQCVGVTKIPKGKWYCPTCKTLPKKVLPKK